MPLSSESTLLCTRDDVTMVDEYKQSMTTSSTHLKKNFQMNTFHVGLKPWMDLYRHCVCPGSYLKYAFLIYNAKLWQSNRGFPVAIGTYLICIITRGLCFYNARHFNDDVTVMGAPIGGEGDSQTTHGSIVVECRIWSWSLMPCEKHGPRDSVVKNRGRRPRFLS